ncbi:hypothetical protein IFM89_034643 [Coptis chinensis]|uniref:Uncharacterized protein n=1 Tax=Coptis chinensis TaxID=261450 RepID=A0A835LU05_9MAGN|nr:hypothetical protein IFM89_034643 [Coptis chinensis]
MNNRVYKNQILALLLSESTKWLRPHWSSSSLLLLASRVFVMIPCLSPTGEQKFSFHGCYHCPNLCCQTYLNGLMVSFGGDGGDDVGADSATGLLGTIVGSEGEITASVRKYQWQILPLIAPPPNLSWLCMGDFNDILHREEKRGGNPVVIHNAMNNHVVGSPSFRLCKQLANCRQSLIHRNHHHFGNINNKIKDINQQISNHQAYVSGKLYPEEANIQYEHDLLMQYNELLKIQEMHWFQKNQCSLILFLTFLTRFVSEMENLDLIKPVTNDEIFTALKSIGSFKAPGPDRFQATVYKTFWLEIEHLVNHMIQNFF